MVEIQKNSFYRRQLIGNAVALYPRFKDFPTGKETTVTLEGGINPRNYVLSGAVASAPSYGSGELTGGYLQFFVSGTILSGAAKLPVAEVYKVIDGVGPTESQSGSAVYPAFELARYNYDGVYPSFTEGCVTVDTDETVTHTADTRIVRGLNVSGTGISAGSFIESITSTTEFEMNQAATASTDPVTLTFKGTYDKDPVGNNMTVISSFLDGDMVWLEETFDGADKTLGTFSLLGDQGTATLSLKDIFLTPKDGEEKIFAGGDAFFGGGASDDISHNLKKYFSAEDDRVYIRPVKKGKINGIWTSTVDNRKDKQKWSIYAPFWKWKDISGLVQFGAQTPATDDLDAAKEANENNTIFNHITSTESFGNVLTTTASKPLLESVVELSTTKKVSGGQSLRLYHLWGSIDNSQNISEDLGDKASAADWDFYKNIERKMGDYIVNPQVARCSIYNIPMPTPIDVGAFNYSFNEDDTILDVTPDADGLLSGAHLTDKRVSFPEIDVKMNIAQLYPSPQLATGTANFGTTPQAYCTVGQNNASSTQSKWLKEEYTNTATLWSGSKGGLNTFLRSVVVTFSNYTPEGYNTLDEFLAECLDERYGVDLTGNVSIPSGSPRKIACGVVFQTFYGNSEYSAKKGGNNLELDETPRKKDQDINPSLIYASALPMCRYTEAQAGALGGLVASGGMAKFDGSDATNGGMLLVRDARIGLSQIGNSSPAVGGGACSIGQGQDDYNTLAKCEAEGGVWRTYKSPRYTGSANVSGTPWGDSGSLHEPSYVKIKKDEWFTMKVVFNPACPNGISKAWDNGDAPQDARGGSYCQSVGDGSIDGDARDYNLSNLKGGSTIDYLNDFGVPIRVYFEGAEVGGQPTGDETSQLPYLNLALPLNSLACSGNATTSTEVVGTQLLRGNNWPKHMTIWVQNYRYTQYSDDEDTGDYEWWRGQYYNKLTSANCKYRGADSKAYPSGLDAEAEVFVDNITFKNWNNEMVNHSINAGQLQRFVQLGHRQLMSPVATFYDDDTTMTGHLKGFDPSGNWQGHNSGHYVCFGFDSPKDLPISGAYNSTPSASLKVIDALGDGGGTYDDNAFNRAAYQLWNNFATGDLGTLLRTQPDLTFVSTLPPYKSTKSAGSAYGFVPYHDGGFHWRFGTQCEGRNLAIYSPLVSGSGDLNTQSLRYTDNGFTFTGWVINNHGTSQASNQAAWAGCGYEFCPVSGTFSSGSVDSYDDTTFYPGFGFVNSTLGITTYPGSAGGGTNRWNANINGSYLMFGTGTTGDFFSTDGLTQKGFVSVNIDNSSNAGSNSAQYNDMQEYNLSFDTYSKWAPRENILASAKILGIEGTPVLGGGALDESLENSSLIVVDNPEIFSAEADDDYIIYRMRKGAEGNQRHMMEPNNADGTGKFPASEHNNASNSDTQYALGFHSTVKLATVKQPIQGTTIALAVFSSGSATARDDGIQKADDNSTDLCIEKHLSELYISPKKYWITMCFLNTDSASKRSYESICNINSTPNEDVDADFPQLGSTYNEFVYSYNAADQITKGAAALTNNPWILEAGGEVTSLDLQDFGHGAFDSDKDTGGAAGKLAILNNRLNTMDIGGVVAGGGMMGGIPGAGGGAPSDKPIVLVLGLSNLTAQKKVVIFGDDFDSQIAGVCNLTDYTTKTTCEANDGVWTAYNYDSINALNPQYIWQYKSPLPTVTDFAVSPVFNALEKDVNLYELEKENLNAVNFTWQEAGDMWYRMLMIDDVPIRNKYHKAKLWIPLNESPDDITPTIKTTLNWYVDPSSAYWGTAQSGTCTVGDEVLQDIQGLQGYASRIVSGSVSHAPQPEGYVFVPTADNSALKNLDEYTFVMHVIPDDQASNRDSVCLFSQGSGNSVGNGFDIYINTDEKIVVSQDGAFLTGTSVIPTDGETPTSIVVTYRKDSNTDGLGPDLRLYINGRIEDYVVTALGNVTTTATEIRVGANYDPSAAQATTLYKGLVEEIIIYEKRWEIVEDSDLYLYDTSPLSDVNAADKYVPHNARLFLYDHHNIRGKNRDEVCSSDQVTWKVTA